VTAGNDNTHAQGAQERDFDWLVDDFVDRVAGVTHALILSADGLPLAGSGSISTDESEQLAAISSGLLSLAHNSAALFDKGGCEQIIIRLSRGYFLFMGIGSGAGLAVLTSPEAQMRVVAYEMTQFVENTGHALTPEVRADLRRVVSARRSA